MALDENDLDMARLLLDRGADIEARDVPGRPPLHWAAYEDRPEAARLLLERGASTGIRVPVEGVLEGRLIRVNRLQAKGRSTPSTVAVQGGSAEVLRLLRDHGVDLNGATSKGDTALHWAATENRAELATLLLDWGADAKATNDAGQTPCEIARFWGSFTGTPLLGRLCRP